MHNKELVFKLEIQFRLAFACNFIKQYKTGSL